MSLSEDLDLDISSALAGIDAVGDALAQSAESYKVALAEALDVLSAVQVGEVDASTVTTSIDEAVQAADLEPDVEATVTADASAVTPEIDAAVEAADAETQVTADVEGLTGSIDAAVGAADATVEVHADAAGMAGEVEAALASAEVTVQVDADTASAEEAVQGLGEAAGGAEGEVTGLETATEGLSSAAELGSGNIDALGGTVASVGGKTGIAAAATTVLAGGIGGLVAAASDADITTRRYDRTVGDLATSIRNVNFGGLSGDLFEITKNAGTSDVAIEKATVRIVGLGRSAGVSNPQIAETSQQVLALATRVSVLNPALGDANDVAERLGPALGRGGRSAQAMGISLTSAEIGARAMQIAMADGRDTVTGFDRIAAGAAITTQKLGANLGKDIADGSQQATVQMRVVRNEVEAVAVAAGKPLLDPLVEAMRKGAPVAESLARIIGTLGSAALPVLAAGFEIVGAVLGPVADLLGEIPAPVLTAVAAFFALRTVLGGLEGLGEKVASGLEQVNRGSGDAGAGLLSLTNQLAGAVAIGATATTMLLNLGPSAQSVAKDILSSGDAAGVSKEAVSAWADELETVGVKADTTRNFLSPLAGAIDALTDSGGNLKDGFRALAEESPQAAQTFIDSWGRAGNATGELQAELDKVVDATAASNVGQDAFRSSVAAATEAMLDEAAAAGDMRAANDSIRQSYDSLSAALQRYHGLVEATLGVQLGAEEAEDRFRSTQIALGEALEKNGATLDNNTKAGLENRAAVRSITESVDTWGTALSKQGFIADNDAARNEFRISKLRELQATYPELATALQPYIDSLGQIKPDIGTKITADPSGAIAGAESSRAALALIPPEHITALLTNNAPLDAGVAAGIIAVKSIQDRHDTEIDGHPERVVEATAVARGEIAAVPNRHDTLLDSDPGPAISGAAAAASALNAIDRYISVTVSVSTVGVAGALAGIAAVQNAGGRQAGGPVAAGNLYVVGEREPEWFVPDVPGTIITPGQMLDALRSIGRSPAIPTTGAGGGDTTINVYEVAADPLATAFAVGTALGQDAER